MAKWCEACGGPLWRADGCRLCWLETVRTMDGTDGRTAWASEPRISRYSRSLYDASELLRCNDTEDTAARSDWLPGEAPPFWTALAILQTRRRQEARSAFACIGDDGKVKP